MRLEYLVDTDWVIHYLTGQSHIVARLDALKEAGLALSVISLAELYEGIYASTDPERNERVCGMTSASSPETFATSRPLKDSE